MIMPTMMTPLNRVYKDIQEDEAFSKLRSNSNFVPGRGNDINSKIMIIGEAPGSVENEKGEPFVGPSGHLLDEWLNYGIFPLTNTFITNAIKYWPHNDGKTYLPVQFAEICRMYLEREWEAIGRPPHIITLGAFASYVMRMPTHYKITKVVSKSIFFLVTKTYCCGKISVHECRDFERLFDPGDKEEKLLYYLHPSFHPSYVLRNPSLRPYALSYWGSLGYRCRTSYF